MQLRFFQVYISSLFDNAMEESHCCREIPEVRNNFFLNDSAICVTELDSFQTCCLNPAVLIYIYLHTLTIMDGMSVPKQKNSFLFRWMFHIRAKRGRYSNGWSRPLLWWHLDRTLAVIGCTYSVKRNVFVNHLTSYVMCSASYSSQNVLELLIK